MQFLGAVSLFLCVASMVAVMMNIHHISVPCFAAALVLMGGSLACLMVEVWISGGALRILLKKIEDR